MSPVQAWLQEIWYGSRPAPWLLRALVPVYRTLTAARRFAYAQGWQHAQALRVPTIVVGNLTAGGTGKTPVVLALVKALRARGFSPGVISRGYGGAARAPMMVEVSTDPAVCGDEPALICRVGDVAVAIGSDRIAAGRLLLTNQPTCDVIISDDGLQHYPLCRNVEICVVDGELRFGNGLLLPAGPLREPVGRLSGIAFTICNGGMAAPGEIQMTLRGDYAVALDALQPRRALADFSGRKIHAVAAIGNPSRFFSMLRAAGLDVIEHPFDDHHRFVAADLDYNDDLPVLMTAKDAVKCVMLPIKNLWQVPVEAQLPDAFFDAVEAILGNSLA